jgi:hypothetical protein
MNNKPYMHNFIGQFFDKSKKLYNIESLPKLSIEIDTNVLNLEIQHWIKKIYSINSKNIPNFYIAYYTKNTSNPEYKKVFSEYFSNLLDSPNLILCAKNSITVSNAKVFYTIEYKLYYLADEGLWVVENISKDKTVYFFLLEEKYYDYYLKEIVNSSQKFTLIEKLLYSIDSDKKPEYYKDNIFYPNTLQNNVDNLCEYYENNFESIECEIKRISRIRDEFSKRFGEKVSLDNIFELWVDGIFDYNIKWKVEEILRNIQTWGYNQIITQETDNNSESSIWKVYSNAHTILESYKNYILVEIGSEFYLYFYIPENELKVLYENRKDEKLFNEKFNNYCLNQEEDDGEDVGEYAGIKEKEKTITVQLKSNEAIVDKEYLQKLENLAKNINRSFNNIVQV